ncbi:MAG: hypothetical protein ABSB79_09620 [Syntrophales bacterium]
MVDHVTLPVPAVTLIVSPADAEFKHDITEAWSGVVVHVRLEPVKCPVCPEELPPPEHIRHKNEQTINRAMKYLDTTFYIPSIINHLAYKCCHYIKHALYRYL